MHALNLQELVLVLRTERGSVSQRVSRTTTRPIAKQWRNSNAIALMESRRSKWEASALFAVGAFRGVSVCSVFTISDILSEDGWLQGYHSEEKLEGLKKIFEVALETKQ